MCGRFVRHSSLSLIEKTFNIDSVEGEAATSYNGTPCGSQCLGDEIYAHVEYARPEDNNGRWILRSPVRTRTYGVADTTGQPAGQVYSESITYYDGAAFEGLPLGQVTHGAPTRVTERIDMSGALRTKTRNR